MRLYSLLCENAANVLCMMHAFARGSVYTENLLWSAMGWRWESRGPTERVEAEFSQAWPTDKCETTAALAQEER